MQLALSALENVIPQEVAALFADVPASDLAPCGVLALVVLTEVLHCFSGLSVTADIEPCQSIENRLVSRNSWDGHRCFGLSARLLMRHTLWLK